MSPIVTLRGGAIARLDAGGVRGRGVTYLNYVLSFVRRLEEYCCYVIELCSAA
jgi:hypothetical protein